MKGGKGSALPVKKDNKVLSKKAEETNLKRKKSVATEGKAKRQSKKPAKDPNMPKRPPGAFFVFMEEFRKTYMAEHPGTKSVSAVGKAAGDKWKSLSEAEKAPYAAKALKKKGEYEKSMQAYNQKKNVVEAKKSEAQEEEDEEEDDEDEVEEDDDE